MGGTYLIEWPIALALLDITQLVRRELPGDRRVFGIECLSRIEPVLPIDLVADVGCQQIAVQDPNRRDTLPELPPGHLFLAA